MKLSGDRVKSLPLWGTEFNTQESKADYGTQCQGSPKPNRPTIWTSWPTSGSMTKRSEMCLLCAVCANTLLTATKTETNLGAVMVV